MSFSLVLLNGEGSGTTFRLGMDQSTVTIGRHSSREVTLDDDRASRLHARVVFRASRYYLEDCGSMNGTFVNSQPVQQTLLEPGDLIRIGQRLILFARSDNPGDFQSSLLKSTTMFGRKTEDAAALVEQSVNEPMSRVVRDSAVLCRLANQVHQMTDTPSLIQAAISGLIDGIAPDLATIWLVAADGRLRCFAKWDQAEADNGLGTELSSDFGVRGEGEADQHSPHVLASLAVERGKAFLIREPSPLGGEDRELRDAEVGAAMGVPIPGRKGPLGAIECYRRPTSSLFARSNLDFTNVVAHQTGLALENLEHRERLELANEQLRLQIEAQNQLIGESPQIQQVMEQIAKVGPSGSTVLLLGESGTGKELVARAIHDASRQNSGPYVAVNCAAFSESLLESELFGHEANAFTGADRRRIGQFERAHRGTIFLDEVGEMSLACQAKLLRLLEGHPFQRLGGEEPIQVQVRLIAATHRDLDELVGQGKFREDLLYRIRVIDLRLPPLRERGEDSCLLAGKFLERFRRQMGRGPRRLADDAKQAILAYGWPGNVRELKNCIERAVVFASDEQLTATDLRLNQNVPAPPAKSLMSLAEAEKRHIAYVLDAVGGNKSQACKVLGIGRGTLYKKLSEDEPAG